MARTSAIRHTKPQPPADLPTSLDEYSNASSTYWPDGWSFARWVRCDGDDLATLTEDEREKIRCGLREVLGEAGMDNLFALMYKAEQGDAITIPASKPNWLRTVERWCPDQEWGFVGYRTCCYDGKDSEGDAHRWEAYKNKLEAAIQSPFSRDGEFPGVGAAASRFRIQWVEDPKLARAGVEVLQNRFAEQQRSLPVGFSQPIFLMTTPSAMDDVLNAPTPGPTARRWRPDAPYILAVAAAGQRPDNIEDPLDDEFDEERAGFQEVFRAAAETLVDELWEIVVGMEWPVFRVTRLTEGVNLKEGEIVDEYDGREVPVRAGMPVLDMVWWSDMPNPYIPESRRPGRGRQ